ncbi:DnaJ C-terminal domain-containing protein [Aquabacterium sp.]|uniref:DnaJ C-terminal domain-containing protein n=1 Tax=Aquabacterium sp. TaxID=1872578 RepID=UPI002C6664A4|nr:DnaJ C-terminal domain-containing protein [Aquabacterium sp.]HSW04811.1 DnaJ C-terminal domain-containing protein [Aquabacterium sp.]
MSIDRAYAELGLPPDASDAQVKAAWRRLVSHWHPDRNASAEAARRMQRINGAYEQIRLSSVTEGVDAGPEGPDSEPPEPSDPAPGRTVRRKLRLSLEEAALGCTRVVRGRLSCPCAACEGSGALAPEAACPRCDGAGTVPSGLWFIWPPVRSTCSGCDGSGLVHRSCLACEGRGQQSLRYQRTVRIPGGVRRGDVLVADGAGEGQGGFDGRLELLIEWRPHPFFVAGDDGSLRCEMPVDGFAWLADAWIEVPTLSGLQQMRLRRGRHVYRLRGQGLPLQRRGSTRGDFVVTVTPSFAESLSAEQQSLLAQLAAAAQGQPAAAAVRDWREALQAWARQQPSASTA